MRIIPADEVGVDGGNAILEFVLLTAMFLIPLTYVIMAVFQVQGAAYGVTEGAREADRAFVEADSLSAAYPQACTAAILALQDQGQRLSSVGCPAQLQFSCVDTQPCSVQLAPRVTIRARLGVSVQLPFLPSSVFGIPLTIHVSATHDEIVDEFRATG
jgi:hypothetical protein